MDFILIISSIVLLLALIGLAILIFTRLDRLSQPKDDDKTIKLLADQIGSLQDRLDKRLDNVGGEMNKRLDNASRAYAQLQGQLGALQQANKQIIEVSKDFRSLQDILRTPKLRGNIGELFLGDLLAQMFHSEQFEMQHRFKDGEIVDAIIKIKDGLLIPVDSKFSLENFQRYLAAGNEEDKISCQKSFYADTKKHIDDIARKYIRPDEGTIEFALMYIPAENVYYEVIIKDEHDIMGYAHKKHVIPVSPSSFYAYLSTILLGLKGMQVEKSAKEILANLTRLRTEIDKFGDDFRLIGVHLDNAGKSYSNADKRLDKFKTKLELSAPEGEQEKLLE